MNTVNTTFSKDLHASHVKDLMDCVPPDELIDVTIVNEFGYRVKGRCEIGSCDTGLVILGMLLPYQNIHDIIITSASMTLLAPKRVTLNKITVVTAADIEKDHARVVE